MIYDNIDKVQELESLGVNKKITDWKWQRANGKRALELGFEVPRGLVKSKIPKFLNL